MAIRIEPAKAPTRCPLCHEELGGLTTGRCHSCATTFHQECLEEMGGCPTTGCAQRGMVPHNVERPSACPVCGEGVPRDSYDCICGGRYHLECVFEGCIRPGCRLFGQPLGGRKPAINFARGINLLSGAIGLLAVIFLLSTLLGSDHLSGDDALWKLGGAGVVLVLSAFSASVTANH
ncbi:MAG: hypothetical protein JKY65_22690 [Planctomycetes bacterium]|nr:hypothetical protein [Planctomycetota bacterium]